MDTDHFGACLEKKIKGECIEEQAYNASAAELRRLTGQDVMYMGPDARINMQKALIAARQKSDEHCHPEHASRTPSIDVSDDALRRYAQQWIELQQQVASHKSCQHPVVQCRGCAKQLCTELSQFICMSIAVCHWCDTNIQPNPFNPLNRETLLPRSDVAAELCQKVDKH